MATQKQKLAAAKIVENGGNVSRAMLEVGYSPQTAKTPQKLTQSEGFKQLLSDSGIDDQMLATVLKEGLEATKVIVMGQGSGESFVDVTPDHPTRHKYLETGLRLRGYAKSEGPTSVTFIDASQRQKVDYEL